MIYAEAVLLVIMLLALLYLLRTRPSKDEVYSLLKVSCKNEKSCMTQRISKLRQSAQEHSATGEAILEEKAELQTSLDDYLKNNRRKTKA